MWIVCENEGTRKVRLTEEPEDEDGTPVRHEAEFDERGRARVSKAAGEYLTGQIPALRAASGPEDEAGWYEPGEETGEDTEDAQEADTAAEGGSD